MSEAAFVPVSPNPYIVGNPVRGRAMFFGREAEFSLVQKRFGQSAHGGLLVFCGERRSGKTSILFQILDLRLGPDFIPVLIDMQSMAVGNEAEFLFRVAEEILKALGGSEGGPAVPDFTSHSNRSALFHRFVQECLRAHPAKKLILLFDEYELFETKIDAGFLSKDVLHILAHLMETAPVFMIFTGSQHVEQRRRDYWGVLARSIYKQISYLEREDALSLIRRPVEGRVDYDDDVVEGILRLSAGQPFYTQAICQSLVDNLNERQTRRATSQGVRDVVDGLVNNPLPQMIFFWDGLAPMDKLVLSLVAECLERPEGTATVDDLLRHLKKRRYPIELDLEPVATTLEKLFKGEMLLRDDRESKPGYAFRMDLWRLWIRRQHSVWQVLREAGEGTFARRNPRPRILTAAAVMAGLLAAAAVLATLLLRRPPLPPDAGRTAQGFLDLAVEPVAADIYVDGRKMSIGTYADSVRAGVAHAIKLSAAGYADSALDVQVAKGVRIQRHVALRPFLGDVRIETQPSGAEIKVDGRSWGRSPITANGLAVASPHAVEASYPGFGVARWDVKVEANQLVKSSYALQVGQADLVITTDPSGAQIQIDGQDRGTSPLSLTLSQGAHKFRATRAGRTPAETTLAVTAETHQIPIQLAAEAPGTLVVRGEVPGQIYVDGVLVVENVQNSGPKTVLPGTHSVRVVLVSGQTIDSDVAVHSKEQVVYDFSRNTTTRKAGPE